MTRRNEQEGFTAVELLITLFIAVAFLVSGYQLYSVIIKDGGKTRAQTKASNVAYDYLRRYTASATTPCGPSTPLTDSPVSISGLSSVTVSVAVTCPYDSLSNISKIEVTVKYNNPQETLKYATYTNEGIPDATLASLSTGLVARWKLNGNANDSSGNNNNGTVNGATLAIGQNGESNNSYSFNGTSNYISGGNLGTFYNQGTIAFWMKADVVENYRNPFTTNYNGINNGIRFEEYTTSSPYGGFSAVIGNASSSNGQSYLPTSILSANTWYHVVLIWNKDTNNVIGYLNNELKFNSVQTVWPTNIPAVAIGNGYDSTRFWKGSIDDVLIYNRVLTSTEVSSLYLAGAR